MGSLAGTRLVYIVAGGRAFEPIKDAARPAEMHLQRRDFVTRATTGSGRRWRSSREWISTAASHARSGTERPRPIKLPSARRCRHQALMANHLPAFYRDRRGVVIASRIQPPFPRSLQPAASPRVRPTQNLPAQPTEPGKQTVAP